MSRIKLQGVVKVHTGGKARERKKLMLHLGKWSVRMNFESMIRCNSEADSIVWMEEGLVETERKQYASRDKTEDLP